MTPKKITILETKTQPQGVGATVLVGLEGGQTLILATMTVQTEDGQLAMNWSIAQSPWRAYTGEGDLSLDLSAILPQVADTVMTVTAAIWRTSPTYRDPEAPDDNQ